MINIVIPIDKWSPQLEVTVGLLQHYKNDVPTTVIIMERPDLNVSECRQLAMQLHGPLICFLDYDSEMMHDHWLDYMWEILDNHADTMGVFGIERWGSEPLRATARYNTFEVNPFDSKCTPAACMLIDTRMCDAVYWDKYIGLRNGWLGGDFEEIDFCMKMHLAGYRIRLCTKTTFHHTGGKTDFQTFANSDRAQSVQVMNRLLTYKYAYQSSTDDADFFKGLSYVKADPCNDNMLAAGSNLRDCYKTVCQRNGIGELV